MAEGDSKYRIEKFTKEYDALCAKYDVKLFAAPQLAPSGERGFNIIGIVVPIDLRQGGVKAKITEDVLK